MFTFFLGVAIGFFMSALINWKYNTSKWIETKYLVWTGVVALVISLAFGWTELQ